MSEVEKTFSWDNKRDCGTHVMAVYDLLYDGKKVCEYLSWSFTSCGIDSFQRMSQDAYGQGVFNDKEKYEKLLKWLETHSPYGSYQPKEFYVCLSTSQVKTGLFDVMLNHPSTRLVDRFLNKAHGPNDIHLYRISLMKDFAKMEVKQ